MSDLENLKRQLAYTFLDAYGNFDGADILFDLIVEATEARIIKLLEKEAHTGVKAIVNLEFKGLLKAIALIKGETE